MGTDALIEWLEKKAEYAWEQAKLAERTGNMHVAAAMRARQQMAECVISKVKQMVEMEEI